VTQGKRRLRELSTYRQSNSSTYFFLFSPFLLQLTTTLLSSLLYNNIRYSSPPLCSSDQLLPSLSVPFRLTSTSSTAPLTIPQHDFESRWLGVATSSHNHGRLQSPHQFSGALAAHFPWSPARLHRIQYSDNGERPFHLVTSLLPSLSAAIPLASFQSDLLSLVFAKKSTTQIMWLSSTSTTMVQSCADPSQPTVQSCIPPPKSLLSKLKDNSKSSISS
jgi:hypothetical protein